MPIFEYICGECKQPSEILVQGSQKPACPSCGSRSLEKQLSVFAVKGGNGTSAALGPVGACGTCGDPRGPGSCSLG